MNALSRITVVRTSRLAPLILILSVAGAFAYRARFADVWVAFGFGLLGYAMKKYGWPRVAFIVALVLGSMFELNLHLTMRLQELGRIQLWTRPGFMLLVFLLVVTLWMPGIRFAAEAREMIGRARRGEEDR